MLNVYSRWVPQLWTTDQKLPRFVMSEGNWAMFEADSDHLVESFHFVEIQFRVSTQDECWIYHFEPETKRQSIEWKCSISPALKKAKGVLSTEKEIACVF